MDRQTSFGRLGAGLVGLLIALGISLAPAACGGDGDSPRAWFLAVREAPRGFAAGEARTGDPRRRFRVAPAIAGGSTSGAARTSVSSDAAVSGTRRAVVVFVRFRDDDRTATHCETRARREWADPDELPAVAHHVLAPSPDPPFADSTLTAYFHEQSLGAFTLYGAAFPRVIVTERDESAYAIGSTRVLDRGALTQEILRRIDADSGFDLSDFDADGDGFVDYVFIVPRNLNHLELVRGGAAGVSDLGYTSPQPEFGGKEPKRIHSTRSGAYGVYGSAGIVIPQLDLIRLMAHEFGHDLWRGTALAGGHIGYLGGAYGVPANGTRRLGYALMVGRVSSSPQSDVVDTRGDVIISAYERRLLGWIDCPVLTESGVVSVGDLYATSDCRRILLPGERTLYVSSRLRVGYFDRLQFNPCQGSFHGLMTTGLLVHVEEAGRLGVVAAGDALELSIDTTAYAGDLFGPGSRTQLTPWTRPNVSGYAVYPPDYRLREGSWQALDDVRYAGDGVLRFDYVEDVRRGMVIREDSWMGPESSGAVFRGDVRVARRAVLHVTEGTVIRFEGGADLVVEEGALLRLGRGAAIELGPGSEIVGDVTGPGRVRQRSKP